MIDDRAAASRAPAESVPRLRDIRWLGIALASGVAALLGAGCVVDRPVGRVPRCGDGVCEARDPLAPEDPALCPLDCPIRACGNGACEAGEESTCPEDCPGTVCGDGTCSGGEDPVRCLEDCPWQWCGNHSCEAPEEGPENCPEDCFPGVCGNGLCEDHERPWSCPADCPATRAVDILFVVDNSGSMQAVQARLAASVPALLDSLLGPAGDALDLRVGVTSTDLGAGGYAITYCELGSSDDGRLLGAAAAGLTSGDFLVDATPERCDAPVGPDGRCVAPSCPEDACGSAPGTAIYFDRETGCPRCRNFAATPSEAVSAMLALGVTGCGFEQPLEAMARAFSRAPEFHRPEAVLLVVFLTDEDDCSAEDPALFDPSQTDLTSPLGPLTSYRCFEFGVSCDVNLRTVGGVRHGCVPRTDPNRMLFPIERYEGVLLGDDGLGLDPGRVVVAVFGGEAETGDVVVGTDAYGNPTVEPSCQGPDDVAARPAIRLRAFASRLHDADDLARFGFHSLCDSDYEGALSRVAEAVRERTGR